METSSNWNVGKIQELIDRNDEAVERAIKALSRRQTSRELQSHMTMEKNGRGWNKLDAPFMTSLSEQLARGRKLSNKQITVARRKLSKYAQQLLDVAVKNGK